MKILSIGGFKGQSNTCLHRHWALTKIASKIDQVETRQTKLSFWYKVANQLFNYGLPIHLPQRRGIDLEIMELVNRNLYNIVWIDKGITINSKILKQIKEKQPKAIIVSYSPDNMMLRHNQSQNFLNSIPFYDYHITTKSYILDDFKKKGAKKVFFTNQSYESTFHYPHELSELDLEQLGGNVGFIGAWEKERCESILYLVDNGIDVKVFGGGKWNDYKNYSPLLSINPGIFSDEYSKALQAFKISLCFLRKMNHDLQTSRTMEIPACGGFMIAERTLEHLNLFEENSEAVYFSSNEELLAKCTHFLKNEAERKQISRNGTKRCLNSGYSNFETLNRLIEKILKNEVNT